jgi:tRNA (guanine37-N1)-methyltransferase
MMTKKPLQINILTLFPNLFTEFINTLPVKRAVEKDLLKIELINIRDFAIDKRGTVDDKPYGGGVGMLIMIEPVFKALKSIYGETFKDKTSLSADQRIVLLSPRGETFNQSKAQELTTYSNITFICGRYEGVDARVEENFVTDVVSIGNFVVSGGEIPTMALVESITRLIPGVIEKEDATKIESFSENYIEFPQYTRPEDFNGIKIPEVLTSGDHKKIQQWRDKNKRTFTVQE